jgi:hypothetical protein
MIFNEALIHLKNGKKMRRKDWGYPSCAYIELLEHNSNLFFYITGEYDTLTKMQIGYGLSYYDIVSLEWEIK